ncbi:MAG: TatD family hydrolase, partial [Salinispira sp.]
RAVPIDRVLLETDSPHLTPVPKRGTINRPAFVSHVYRFFAELRGMTPHEVQEQVSENFIRAVPRSAGGEGRPVPE